MNIALLLSGGTGNRVGGDIPKQYISIGGRMIITYSIKVLIENELIDIIEIVADAKYHDILRQEISNLRNEHGLKNKPVYFSLPGANRQLSIYNGLLDIEANVLNCNAGKSDDSAIEDNNTVFIHDAARPLLSMDMITRCYEALNGHDGVLPVIPMKDTVYLSKDGKSVTSLLNRSEIFAGQAPELFVYEKYFEANKELLPDKIMNINGSTEPAIMAGMDIAMIPGDEGNYKITTKEDLDRFRQNIEKETKAN